MRENFPPSILFFFFFFHTILFLLWVYVYSCMSLECVYFCFSHFSVDNILRNWAVAINLSWIIHHPRFIHYPMRAMPVENNWKPSKLRVLHCWSVPPSIHYLYRLGNFTATAYIAQLVCQCTLTHFKHIYMYTYTLFCLTLPALYGNHRNARQILLAHACKWQNDNGNGIFESGSRVICTCVYICGYVF